MFFGRRQQQPTGMTMKTKFMLILFIVALVYIFKGPIMAHFGFEPKAPKLQEVQEPASKMLPQTAMVIQSATVFQEPGRKPYATVGAGQPVSILDAEDSGQSYISIRHNGMAGYISRRDLSLGN